jgi:hypothetical protein
LTANVSGFQVKRIISIEKSDGAEVKIETELTNISEKVSSTGLFIHPVMNINRCLDSLNITMLVKDGSVQKNNINLGLMDQPCGAWAIIDEIANVGIANLFDPAQARSKLHVDYVCNSFNMELISNEHLLNPGQSFIIKNRYVLLDDAEKQLEHVLGMPVNLGKIDFRRFCE